MLNEDFADRTLPPTERRRREARMRGEVARSSDLNSALLLLAAGCALWLLGPGTVNVLTRHVRNSITAPPLESLTIGSASELLAAGGRAMATVAGPIMLVVMLAAIVANLLQTGWLWTPAALFSPNRLGACLTGDSATKAAMMVIRVCVAAGVTVRFLMTHSGLLHSVGQAQPIAMLIQPARILGELCIQLACALVMVALVDYGIRFWRHEQQLKMTVEERRRELRDESTDPQVKKRQLAMATGQSASMPLAEIGQIEKS